MCEGCWTQSSFYLQLKEKKRNRSFGARKWLVRSELVQKFGSAAVADAIIQAKHADTEAAQSQIRAHPDLHGLDTPDP